jgi:heat shock protein HtpX
MKYVGLHTQIWRNNIKSIVLLILFPAVIFLLVWLFLYFLSEQPVQRFYYTNQNFLRFIPWISIAVFTWFAIAFIFHSSMIRKATGSVPLERAENKRVYNLVENLCIGAGIKMPKINLICEWYQCIYLHGILIQGYYR